MQQHPQTRRRRGRYLMAVRARMMWDNPLCSGPDSECEKAGRIRAWTQIDHIKPLGKGGDDVQSNRQGLCDECHAAKTRRDMGHKPMVAIGRDGYPLPGAVAGRGGRS